MAQEVGFWASLIAVHISAGEEGSDVKYVVSSSTLSSTSSQQPASRLPIRCVFALLLYVLLLLLLCLEHDMLLPEHFVCTFQASACTWSNKPA